MMNENEKELNDLIEETEETAAEAEIAEEAVIEAPVDETADKPKAKKEKKADRARNLRRLRYGTTSTAVTVVVIAAVMLFNVIAGIVADRHPITIDLSKDKIYSLSDESISIAKKVDKDIEIVVFADESYFSASATGANGGVPEYDTAMKEFYNALKQYNTYSGGKIKYSYIDPNQEPTKFAAYQKYEVSSGSILFLCGEQSRVCTVNDLYELDDSNYYYSGTYEFSSRVEKTLASNLYILSGGEEHIVQVLIGHEEDNYVIDGLKSLYELNGYTFEENTITGSTDFNKDAEVMLIAAPAKDYSAAEIQRVRDWVYNDGSYGRTLLVYVSPTADCPNLYGLLDVEYKITVTDQIFWETDYNRVQNYNPLYSVADVPTSDFAGDASGSTGKVFAPQARRLTTTLGSDTTDNTTDRFGIPLTSYPTSTQVLTLEDLTNSDSSGATTLPADQYPLSGTILHHIRTFNNNTQESVNGNVFVCGCPLMAYGELLTNSAYKNEDLLLGSLNKMTGVENAITISNKNLSVDTISFKTAAQNLLGLFFGIILPLLLIIVGIIVFVRRKNL